MINISLDTVITMIGPSMSGKSYLANQLAEQVRRDYPLVNVSLISSDTLRRELLGDHSLDRHDPRMGYASDGAFDLLFKHLEVSTRYPQSLRNRIVIVDTTGLDEAFRKRVVSVASSNGYASAAIALVYKGGVTEYLKYVETSPEREVIARRGIDRLKTKVLPRIGTADYKAGVFRVTKKDFTDVRITINNYSLLEESYLDPSQDYFVVGDTHGDYQSLMSLLSSAGLLKGEELLGNVILVGDFIDKYPSKEDQIKLINFIHDSYPLLRTIRGNHEEYVVRSLMGESFSHNEYFNSIDLFREDTDLRSKLETIYLRSPFFFYSDGFVVTHSPCPSNHLTKLSPKLLKSQTKCTYPYIEDYESMGVYEKALAESLSFVTRQAGRGLPIHISGHIPLATPQRVGHQFLIDTGSVYGNKLTGVSTRSLKIISVSNSHPSSPLPNPPLVKETPKVLGPRDQDRLSQIQDTINFLTYTITPAPATSTELEPLSSALSYYQEKGVERLVIQPKYMGSFCSLYYKQGSIRFFSRKGYEIKGEEVDKLGREWIRRLETIENLEYLILSGELLPWSFMAKELIDREFSRVYSSNHLELEGIELHGLYQRLGEMDLEIESYLKDRVLNRADRDAKYSSHRVSWYENYLKLDKPTPSRLDQLDAYRKQVEIYSKEGPLEFKSFLVTKVKYKGKKEEVLPFNNLEGFEYFNSDRVLVISPTELDKATEFYEDLVAKEYEGVVIKPLEHLLDVLPAMKVRNTNYLRLVYGPFYDSLRTYKALVRTKSIGAKTRQSMVEYRLYREMLDRTYGSSIGDLLIKFLGEEERSKDIDPRL